MGPLKDIKAIEFSGIGPGPYCGMLLADLGADVIRVSRKETKGLQNNFSSHGHLCNTLRLAHTIHDEVHRCMAC